MKHFQARHLLVFSIEDYCSHFIIVGSAILLASPKLLRLDKKRNEFLCVVLDFS